MESNQENPPASSDLSSTFSLTSDFPTSISSDVKVTTDVDLNESDGQLTVDISDALSERDWVKFTVHTKTNLGSYSKSEFSVIRLHEEFIWLRDTFNESPEYAGYIIPPSPPRPDFDASREKLRKLGDAEGNLTKEEFTKMKQELEAEYLATFKKTVAMHETFLTRLATHPVFKFDRNLQIFLEYDKDLNVRGKNKKEKLVGLLSTFHRTGDELLLGSTVREVDDFFNGEKHFLVEYHSQLKDCTIKADKMSVLHKGVADTYIKISQGFTDMANLNNMADNPFTLFLHKVAECLEKMRRIEGRVASDQDLKLSDTMRYHSRETSAAKELLYRRIRCLANYENANKNLDKARAKYRDVNIAENQQQEACKEFEQISSKSKEELKLLKNRRVSAFKKSLTDLAELELKHSKAHAQMLRTTIASLKAEM